MTDEERRLFKRTDTMNLSQDLQEWLSNYYWSQTISSPTDREISDELYEMFGDMADDFIEKVFEPYKRALNEPTED